MQSQSAPCPPCTGCPSRARTFLCPGFWWCPGRCRSTSNRKTFPSKTSLVDFELLQWCSSQLHQWLPLAALEVLQMNPGGNCIKLGLPGKLIHSKRKKFFGKSYSLESGLRESIFREDLFYTIGPWNIFPNFSDSSFRWRSFREGSRMLEHIFMAPPTIATAGTQVPTFKVVQWLDGPKILDLPWLNFIRITISVPGRDGAVTTFIQFGVFYCWNLGFLSLSQWYVE